MKRTGLTGALLLTAVLLTSSCGAKNSSQEQESIAAEQEGITQEQEDLAPEQETAAQNDFRALAGEDLSGAAVGPEVLAGHKITMINVWGTFCPPCIEEMPDLAKLNEEYQDEGFQVVGMVIDAAGIDQKNKDKVVETANSIIAQTGANYQHIIPGEELLTGIFRDLQYVPSTYFVNEQGELVGKAYAGARSKADWQELIEEALKTN